MNKNKIYSIAITSVFAALLCVICPFSISAGAIPFTLAVFGIMLCGALLSPLKSVCAVLVYVAIGALGFPVFSGMTGGIGVLAGPTGGYIAAYPFTALIVSLFVKKATANRPLRLIAGMLCALAALYLIGTAWYCIYAGVSPVAGLMACVVPFVPFDLLKCVLCFACFTALKKIPAIDKLRES